MVDCLCYWRKAEKLAFLSH